MKITSIVIKISASVIIFALGFAMMILGAAGEVSYFSGEATLKETYGGDAYTGIQNSAADTSNNVRYLGNFFKELACLSYILLGILIMLLSIYLFGATLFMIENKKTNLKIEKTPAEIKNDTTEIVSIYKNLLQSGAITQEEFDDKLKKIFNI